VTRDFTKKFRSDKGGVTRDVRIDRNGTVYRVRRMRCIYVLTQSCDIINFTIQCPAVVIIHLNLYSSHGTSSNYIIFTFLLLLIENMSCSVHNGMKKILLRNASG
jgi:hypothetical protein